MGGDTNSLMPPNNTSIATILKTMKEKTDRKTRPTKNKLIQEHKKYLIWNQKRNLNINQKHQ
jgi:hypothetical protein